MIVAIVFVVGLVGFLTVLPHTDIGASIAQNDLTSNVVQDTASATTDACGHCVGSPVCGGKNGKAIDYPSACAAQCDGARIVFGQECSRIPQTTN